MALFLSLFLESLELPAGPRVKKIGSSKEGKVESTNLDSVSIVKRLAQGYKYPVPDNPLTFPTKTFSTTTPSSTTDSKESATTLETSIIPNCIHEIEASIGRNPEFLDSGVPLCPSDEPVAGYEYPVPENPLTLPTELTTLTTTTTTTYFPDCIPEEEASIGRNPEFLDFGVPLCPSDEPVTGYEYPVPENPFTLPTKPALATTTTSQATTTTPATKTATTNVPDCIPKEEASIGRNYEFLDLGVPLCPPNEPVTGYEYHVPENPLTLPTKPTTTTPPKTTTDTTTEQTTATTPVTTTTTTTNVPDCIPEGEASIGRNPEFLDSGVPLCTSDEPVTGYEYPVPENPFTLPTTPAITTTPATTTALLFVPDCILEGEASIGRNPEFLDLGVPLCASNEPVTGYEYPVPENPFTLPTKPTLATTTTSQATTTTPVTKTATTNLPDCISEEEASIGRNPEYLDLGVPLCPSDELVTGYEYPVPENPLILPTKPTTPATTTTSTITPPPTTTATTTEQTTATTPVTTTTTTKNVPDCIPEEEASIGRNPEFLDLGVPLCPSDEPVTGYEYPVPENPFTLPTKPTTTTPAITTYVPDCIPEEETSIGRNPEFLDSGVPLCASNEPVTGYEYPVPENPFTLPTKPTLATTTTLQATTTTPATKTTTTNIPDCIPEEETSIGRNPEFLESGVPLCASDEPVTGYEYPVPENPLTLPTESTEPTTTTTKNVPNCILEEEANIGRNPEFLDLGVPLCPSDEPVTGYEYPVLENLFTLPTTPATTTTPETTTTTTTALYVPDCILEGEASIGRNPAFLDSGVPLCASNEPVTGYEYRIPESPFTFPTKPTTTAQATTTTPATTTTTPYVPDCIPEEEASIGSNHEFLDLGVPLCPSDEPVTGYEYPVPENPFTLPTKPTTTTPATTTYVPDCILEEEASIDRNPEFLDLGVPLCPSDKPVTGYKYPVPENPLTLPTTTQTTATTPEATTPETTKTTTIFVPVPDCILIEEANIGGNTEFLDLGVPLCPSDEPVTGYEYPVPENPFTLPTKPTTTKPTTTTPSPPTTITTTTTTSTTTTTTTTDTTATTTTPASTTTPATTTTTTTYVPDCIPEEEANIGRNPEFLDSGVPLCPSDKPVTGYEYSVPENPLTLPTKPTMISQTTTTTPATTTTTYVPDCILEEEASLSKNTEFLYLGVPLCHSDKPVTGYEYPVPENPFTLPTKPTTPATTSYVQNCIPEEEASIGRNPEFLNLGVPLCTSYEPVTDYEYPVPENPFTLPTKPTTPATTTYVPDCILEEEASIGRNPEFLDLGVPLCPSNDPDFGFEVKGLKDFDYESEIADTTSSKTTTSRTNSAKPPKTTSTYVPDCVPEEEASIGRNPEFFDSGVPLCPSDEPVTGYEYPVPENPLTLPSNPTTAPATTTTPATTKTTNVPDCIREKEASIGRNPQFLDFGVPLCPSDEPVTGYEYPVPENPLTLPTKPTTAITTTALATTNTPVTTTTYVPDCILEEEVSIGKNPEYLDLGVPLCPFDEPVTGYEYPVPENPLILPSKGDTSGDEVVGLRNFDYESGISIQRKGIILICSVNT